MLFLGNLKNLHGISLLLLILVFATPIAKTQDNVCDVVDTQKPGDDVDNDCDTKIDEEKYDGVDNDGDGKVDEDIQPRIIVAFVTGGFEYQTGTNPTIERMASDLRNEPGVVARVFSQNDRLLAIPYLSQYKSDELIRVLVGFSRGGGAIHEVARKLEDDNINVDRFVQIDTVGHNLLDKDNVALPKNVEVGLNYFQGVLTEDVVECSININAETRFHTTLTHLTIILNASLKAEVKKFILRGEIPTGLGVTEIGFYCPQSKSFSSEWRLRNVGGLSCNLFEPDTIITLERGVTDNEIIQIDNDGKNVTYNYEELGLYSALEDDKIIFSPSTTYMLYLSKEGCSYNFDLVSTGLRQGEEGSDKVPSGSGNDLVDDSHAISSEYLELFQQLWEKHLVNPMIYLDLEHITGTEDDDERDNFPAVWIDVNNPPTELGPVLNLLGGNDTLRLTRTAESTWIDGGDGEDTLNITGVRTVEVDLGAGYVIFETQKDEKNLPQFFAGTVNFEHIVLQHWPYMSILRGTAGSNVFILGEGKHQIDGRGGDDIVQIQDPYTYVIAGNLGVNGEIFINGTLVAGVFQNTSKGYYLEIGETGFLAEQTSEGLVISPYSETSWNPPGNITLTDYQPGYYQIDLEGLTNQ